MHIELHEWRVANAAEAMDLPSLDDENVTCTGLDFLSVDGPQTAAFPHELDFIVRMTMEPRTTPIVLYFFFPFARAPARFFFTLNFTIFLIRSKGMGLSNGNLAVPLPAAYIDSSFLNSAFSFGRVSISRSPAACRGRSSTRGLALSMRW